MNPNTVRIVCSLIVPAILGVIWFVYQPQGSWAGIYMFTGLIAACSSAVVFYGGAGNRVFAAPIAMMFLFGAYSSATWGSFNQEAFDNLNAHLPGYSSNIDYIEERSESPPMKRGEAMWRIRTTDTIEQVRRFYGDPGNSGTLNAVRTKDPKMFVFRSDTKTVTVELSRSSGITEILYRLSEARPAGDSRAHASVHD